MFKRTFLGTGLIGASFAQAALVRGDEVELWNRSPGKAKALEQYGGKARATAIEAVQNAQLIHIALTSDEAVDALLLTIKDAIPQDAIVMDHSTNLPAGTKTRSQWCEEHGVRYLSCPIFMSPKACLAAAGLILVAGHQTLFQTVEPALQAMTGKLWYVGESAEKAASLKIIGNGLILTMVSGLADVLTLGQSLGLDGPEAFELFQHFDPGLVVKGRGAQMAQGNFDTLWSLQMARKDIGLMLQSVGDKPLAVLPAIASRMDQLIEDGDGDHDVGIMAKAAHKSR
jgi:3-hydroxyisobutyrate dehydrogenase